MVESCLIRPGIIGFQLLFSNGLSSPASKLTVPVYLYKRTSKTSSINPANKADASSERQMNYKRLKLRASFRIPLTDVLVVSDV